MQTKSQHLKNRFSKKRLWMSVSIILFAAGLYFLVTIFAPNLPPTPIPEAKIQKILASTSEIKENRLYLPKIGVDVSIVEGDSANALEKGAWHRRPASGDPEKGGNFVLSAHRFNMGLTPQHTLAKSPFYHIDEIQIGDKIYATYNQKSYAYEVIRKYKVPRTAVEIEAPSNEPKMTLYSCDLRGEAAGREVIEARPLP